MIVVKLTMLEGRSSEQKNDLIRRLTESAAKNLGEPASNIRVIIYEVPPSNWGAGGISLEQKK
jgi:4-oxalocrotonate tautomerase